MKRVLFLITIASLSFFYFFTTSCSKSVTTTIRDTVYMLPANTIEGEWAGTYMINGAPATDSFAYYFAIRSDSTVLTIGSGTNGTAGYAEGPWTLSGTTFSATLTSLNGTTPENVQTVTATYDSTKGVLTGTWLDVSGSDVGSGTLVLKRIP
jgi:hypothetical protein